MAAGWYYLLIVAGAVVLIVGAIVLNEIRVAREARELRAGMLASYTSEERERGDSMLLAETEVVNRDGRRADSLAAYRSEQASARRLK